MLDKIQLEGRFQQDVKRGENEVGGAPKNCQASFTKYSKPLRVHKTNRQNLCKLCKILLLSIYFYTNIQRRCRVCFFIFHFKC